VGWVVCGGIYFHAYCLYDVCLMAKKNKKNKKRSDKDLTPRIANRKAYHDYHIQEKVECGIALHGCEVKSIRDSLVTLSEGFVRVERGELWLINVDIGQYSHAMGVNGHSNRRTRKLLAHGREIRKMKLACDAKGLSIVPLAMYFVRGLVKVEIGVGAGKKDHDKRQDLKKKEATRDMQRALSSKR